MKKIFSLISVLSLLAMSASAQLGTNTSQTVGATGGTFYTALNGGTNNQVSVTTNSSYTNIVLNVSQHPNFGLELAYNCWTASTNGSIIVDLAQSFDGGNTYETTPSLHVTNALPTFLQFAANLTNYVADFNLSATNATHVRIAGIEDTGSNAAGYITNLAVVFNLNNPTVWTVPAPR